MLSVFGAYAKEACELAQHGVWAAERSESECLKFLRQSAEDVRVTDDGEISSKLQAKIESSEEWKVYRSRLREVADAQARDGHSLPAHSTKARGDASIAAKDAKRARAKAVAQILTELNILKPQMFDDKAEYERLQHRYANFLTFQIAANRPDLLAKLLGIQGSTRHIRLAQEIAGAYYGKALATIQDEWKRHKPPDFKRQK
jgi:hypothetical protein